jgi:[protein-PII] uridylyltransferase
VEIAPARHDDTVELVVVADDVPGLLAKIAAALTANRLEVLAARIHSRSHALRFEAVDVFSVRPRGEIAPERLVAGVRSDLERLIRGDVDAAALLTQRHGAGSPWRERPSPPIEARVVTDEWTSPTHTIVEVVAKDRPGLLYRLARALHELHLTIAIAKITTEGAKAIDVFYVSEEDGSKVESKERLARIRDRLLEAVGTQGKGAKR